MTSGLENGPASDAGSIGNVCELSVRGMNCNNCARHVTEALQEVPGVASASVFLEQHRASVRWLASASPNPESLVAAVKQAGYDAAVLPSGAGLTAPTGGASSWSPLAGWRLNIWLGSAVTLPLLAGEWLFDAGMQPWFRWLAFALATPVQVLCGARFYQGAWSQLKGRRASMDTLVALGSTTAYAYSVAALFSAWEGHVYFMEAAAIITLISIGHWLEARASARAADALKSLLELAPPTARRREPGGVEVDVPVANLRLEDRVILRPGDRVPTDGVVEEGGGAVDEAMLTGEAMPVEKKGGDRLCAGTVNLDGRLVMRVTAVGESTALAHIIAAVQRAQNSRANIQRLGDQVSNVFVPVVLVLAVVTALGWGLAPQSAREAHQWLAQWLWQVHLPPGILAGAAIHAAAVLIIACPCAMGLATPVAIMVGTNVAARRGILVRDALALEKAGTISAVVFDKTGTLTQGRPGVAQFEKLPGRDPRLQAETIRIAAALGRRSTHPLSQAVARLNADDLMLEGWREIRGSGVEAQLRLPPLLPSAVPVRLGSLTWLQSIGVDLAPGSVFAADWSGRGATVLGVTADERLVAVLAVQDILKPGARKVVDALAGDGAAIYLVTGDSRQTAASIALQAGIPGDRVFAEVRPEQKPEIVRELQGQGHRVAFVGDGINDAPALEQSDLGIAVCQASDVAREAADLVLLKSELVAVPEALGLAKATLRTIRQNLFWAFFYNAAAVPLAALGFLSPVLCAAAMGLSDLVVIGNALRLRRWRAGTEKNPAR